MHKFNVEKAIQAAGVLLRDSPKHSMGRVRFLKLLYLADRRVMQEKGRPLLYGRTIAMKHGPLHDEIYGLIKGEHIGSPRWSEHFRNDHYQVVMDGDMPGVSALSPYEIRTLQNVAQELAEKGEWEVVEVTHELPEWRRNYREGTSTTIPLEHIAAAVGRSEQANAICVEAEALNDLHHALRSAAAE